MAKTSSIWKNFKRIKLVEAGKVIRDKLKEIIRTNPEERDDAILKLQKRKRNESPCRVRDRCRDETCGRPNGTYKKFGLCRIHLREAAMRGDVPGLKKSSW